MPRLPLARAALTWAMTSAGPSGKLTSGLAALSSDATPARSRICAPPLHAGTSTEVERPEQRRSVQPEGVGDVEHRLEGLPRREADPACGVCLPEARCAPLLEDDDAHRVVVFVGDVVGEAVRVVEHRHDVDQRVRVACLDRRESAVKPHDAPGANDPQPAAEAAAVRSPSSVSLTLASTSAGLSPELGLLIVNEYVTVVARQLPRLGRP